MYVLRYPAQRPTMDLDKKTHDYSFTYFKIILLRVLKMELMGETLILADIILISHGLS